MSSCNVSKRSLGVDLSAFQVDSVAAYAGAKFAIVKVTEGMGYVNPRAKAQIKSAKANGMLPMAYFFATHGANASAAKAQAQFAVNKAKEYGIPAGSYIADDWETGDGNRVNDGKNASADAIIAAMRVIKAAGYKPLLYSGASLLKNNVNCSKVIKEFGVCLWVASYATMGRIDTPNFNYFPSMDGVAIWQFTSNWKGKDVDGNITLIDLKADSTKSAPAHKTATPTKAVSLHPVVKWDVGGVAVVSNADGAYIYTSSKLDKRESDKLKPQGSAWQVLGIADGAVKVGKNQYMDGRAVYIKLNPIAYNSSKHGVAKIVMPHTHALAEPKADAEKVYGLDLNSKIEFEGREGRFLKIKNKYKGKTVYVTGNRAFVVL